MAIPKVMGIETEYGISSPGQPDFNPVLTSSMLIGTWAGALRRIRWDYEQESPMRDARGYEPVQPRAGIEEDTGLANVLLPNGSRYYVDHAHPEYSTPECLTPHELVIADRAGERIVEDSLDKLIAAMPDLGGVLIHKNNSDGKGNSYGCHENYLVSREVAFSDIARDLTPFFVTRQIFTGAGKVGVEGRWGEEDAEVGYQLSQRADFFEAEVGLETTLKRPIINTRDEPHADPARYRRLHVIVGDANMSDVSTFLKVGTTALVLKLIEDGALPDLSLDGPVDAMHEVSRDLTCRVDLSMTDGALTNPLDLQWRYLELCRTWVRDNEPSTENEEVLSRWDETLAALEADPMKLVEQLDWVAKYRVLLGYRERDGLAWNDPRLRMIDLQYHDVRRAKGLAHRLEASGRLERLTTDAQVETAMEQPPGSTRAWFRGNCVGRFPESVAAGSWDSLTLDPGGSELIRVPMREPLRGTRAHTQDLFDRASDVAELLELLQS